MLCLRYLQSPKRWFIHYNIERRKETYMNKKEGEATNITSATPTQEGYAFTGWNTTKDGTGTTYQPGESYTKDEEVTLYAQWRRYVHTVKFDANGGTLTDEQATKTYGMEFNLSAYKPTRNGYTFLGWNTAQDGSGTTYTDQYNYDQDGGTVTLYAQWIQYNVNIIELDKQQGTGGTDALYDKGDEKSWYLDKECKLSIEENGSIDKPKREGYWFNGYYTEQNGNGDQIFDHNGNKTSKFIHGNCKIYAYWTAYKFTLDADGGEVSQTEITSTDGGVLPSATKEGLIFVGWARYSGEVSIKANTPYALKDLEDSWKNKVRIIAVSIDDARAMAKVKSLVKGKKWPFEVLLDPNKELYKAFNISAIPYVLVINDKKVVWTHSGYMPGNEVLVVDKALETIGKK